MTQMLSALKYLHKSARTLIGFLLLVSASAKATDPVRFGRQVEQLWGIYGANLPVYWVDMALGAGILVILLEFWLGSWMITGYRGKFASGAAAALLSVFVWFIIREVMAGRGTADCGCFGALLQRTHLQALTQNGVLMAVCLLAWYAPSQNQRHRLHGSLILSGLLLLAAGVAFALHPPWGVLREGLKWQQIDRIGEVKPLDTQWLWLLDPDCAECRDRLPVVEAFTAARDHTPILALTDQTAGRIQEFIWDFQPGFAIQRISDGLSKRLFLPAGSMVQVRDGKVEKIWRPAQVSPEIRATDNTPPIAGTVSTERDTQ